MRRCRPNRHRSAPSTPSAPSSRPMRWLIDLLEASAVDDWDRPTIVAGWHVRHVAGHLLDTALRRLIHRPRRRSRRSGPASGSPEDVRAFVDRVNAEGVAVYGRFSPRVLRRADGRWRPRAARAPASTRPDGAGGVRGELGRRDRRRRTGSTLARELTERWHHQQQIRLALDRPGIMTRAMYHPVLDCFMRVLPHAYRDGGRAAGHRRRDARRAATAGACLAAEPCRPIAGWSTADDESPRRRRRAARITVPEDVAWRLFTKGLPADEAARVDRPSRATRRSPRRRSRAVAIVG